MNEFGSAERGKGKACANTRRLALITEDMLEDMESEFFRDRANDVHDVGRRVLRHLGQLPRDELSSLPPQTVLVARELARQRRHDAVICLSAVIRGDTPHHEYNAAEATKGQSATTASNTACFEAFTRPHIAFFPACGVPQ